MKAGHNSEFEDHLQILDVFGLLHDLKLAKQKNNCRTRKSSSFTSMVMLETDTKVLLKISELHTI